MQSPNTVPHIQYTCNKFNKLLEYPVLQVDECPRCQRHEKIKTVAPVLHPISVKEAWSVLGVDLMGPLPTTAKGKR